MAMTKSSGVNRAKVTVATKKPMVAMKQHTVPAKQKPIAPVSVPAKQKPIAPVSALAGKPASKAPIGQSPLAKSGFSVMQKAKAQAAKKAGIVLGKKKPMR